MASRAPRRRAPSARAHSSSRQFRSASGSIATPAPSDVTLSGCHVALAERIDRRLLGEADAERAKVGEALRRAHASLSARQRGGTSRQDCGARPPLPRQARPCARRASSAAPAGESRPRRRSRLASGSASAIPPRQASRPAPASRPRPRQAGARSWRAPRSARPGPRQGRARPRQSRLPDERPAARRCATISAASAQAQHSGAVATAHRAKDTTTPGAMKPGKLLGVPVGEADAAIGAGLPICSARRCREWRSPGRSGRSALSRAGCSGRAAA